MSKSDTKYKPEMSKQLIEFGKQGLARTQVASRLGISRRLLYNWLEDSSKPEFLEAYERYKTELSCYQHDRLQEMIEGKKNCKGLGALIYRGRVLLGKDEPEWLVDLKKEIVTENKPSHNQVKEELKKILSNNFNLLQFITSESSDVEPDRPNS